MSKFIRLIKDYLVGAFTLLTNNILPYFINQLRVIRADLENGINGLSLDAGLESDDPQIFKLAAEVKIKRRLNNLVEVNENFEEDSRYITCAEYQLFANESQYVSPRNWQNNRFKPSDAKNYVSGLSKRDANRFCTWLTGRYLLSSRFSQLKAFYKPLSENGKLRLARVKLASRYSQLAKYLYKNQWEKADGETSRLMLQAVGHEERGYLTLKDIASFSCEDLYTINLLWVVYSQGHFGFSVQLEIYQSLGGTLDTFNIIFMDNILSKYSSCVGWWNLERSRNSYAFYLKNTRRGNLPSCLPFGGFPRRCTVETMRKDELNAYIYFFSRLEVCEF